MTPREEVAAMRLQTEITGLLTEVQVKSVSMWPKVAILGLKSYETQINLETQEITYVIKLKPKQKFDPSKDIKDLQLIKIIETSAWALLGDTWKIVFKTAKGVILYDGKRRKGLDNGIGLSFGNGRGSFNG